jgi:hypothetical protein
MSLSSWLTSWASAWRVCRAEPACQKAGLHCLTESALGQTGVCIAVAECLASQLVVCLSAPGRQEGGLAECGAPSL